MSDDAVVRRFGQALAVHDSGLRDALRQVLLERTFPLHPRGRGEASLLHAADAVRGVRIVYGYGDWGPFACGLSVAGAWKCGARPLLTSGTVLFDELVEEDDSDDMLEAVDEWIRSAWLDVRSVAPDLRGFASEHDTDEMLDLDTGVMTTEKAAGLGYL